MDEANKSKREDVCPGKKLDLATVEQKLAETKGPEYWRSLEELAGSPEFREMMHREFPKGASEWLDSVSRRGFLQLMGASLAMAGMTGCTKMPVEEIVPYVRQPEQVIPGRPQFYATAFTLSGYANPLLVESHLGRPTKIEGNTLHPASMGGTDVFAQGSILGLYDPDRLQSVLHLGDVDSWASFVSAIKGPLTIQKSLQGAGLRILTPTVSSPTFKDQMQVFLAAHPQAKWHVYEPINRDNVLEGAKLAFGQPVETRYDFSKADVIVSLDADFLYAGFPGNTRYIRDFASRRNPDSGIMNRLYVIESTPSSTGLKADHRLPVRASAFMSLLSELMFDFDGTTGREMGTIGDLAPEQGGKAAKAFLTALGKDLGAHRGSSIVLAGDHQPPQVHVAVHLLNQVLGNVGKTVFYTDPVNANPINQTESIKELVSDMTAGKVDLLVILGGNPVYDAPADLKFADAMKSSRVAMRVYLGLYENETAQLCHWSVGEAHYLESWSDSRAYDGTVSIVQPLISPLYGGKNAHEMLAALMGTFDANGYDIVRDYWLKQHSGGDFEAWWRKSLNDGFIEGTAFAPKTIAAKTGSIPASAAANADPNSLEVNFRRDPSVYDGQFSNNGWLQELPKPLSKLTWDNAVFVGPKMAERAGLKNMDVVALELNGQKVEGAVWIQAGHPDHSVTVNLGYGRRAAGRAGTGAGFDVYPLRTTNSLWIATGAKLTKTGGFYQLASTQGYQTMDTGDGSIRPVVREATLEEYRKEPKFAKEDEPPAELTLYPPFDYKKSPDAWGMTIDLNACVGCNNCIVACQSENNIAVVGKEQTTRGRHMHWLRVDAYYQGDRDDPTAYFQPVPCMQCENAPCELVCPVGATTHSTEGLNDMVYNRCIGTRYCSNNCPYKVRRFNFLLFQDWETPQYKIMRNPDVTVRSRGVMEKCSYCIQRISEHRIDAETAAVRENRPFKIEDGSLQTACQQSCPANAIVFGNINDPDSRVSKLKALDRNYGLLADLNTRPRTTYLAEIRNPNPELEGQKA
jgi:MoCo/4Fe-4S cofactor protein with predicted Tat translocation signal